MSNRARERAWRQKTKSMTSKAIEALIAGILLGKQTFKSGGKSVKKPKVAVVVHKVLSITPGGRHVWVRSNVGTIRKPIGEFTLEGRV